MYTKYYAQILFTNLPKSEHFSFTGLIHTPGGCDYCTGVPKAAHTERLRKSFTVLGVQEGNQKTSHQLPHAVQHISFA